jgi:hypothetical protein
VFAGPRADELNSETALNTLFLVGLVGGLITGISPCVLPVLPVIFLSAGAGQPGVDTDRRRPYLVIAGLTLSFSVFTLLGTLTLDALPLPKDIIRWAGLVVLVLLGIGMIVPRIEQALEKPFSRIPQRGVSNDPRRVHPRPGPGCRVRPVCRTRPGGDHGRRGHREDRPAHDRPDRRVRHRYGGPAALLRARRAQDSPSGCAPSGATSAASGSAPGPSLSRSPSRSPSM